MLMKQLNCFGDLVMNARKIVSRGNFDKKKARAFYFMALAMVAQFERYMYEKGVDHSGLTKILREILREDFLDIVGS